MTKQKEEIQKTPIALREEEILKFWNDEKIFEKSVETPAGKTNPEEFTFYDGPPFATGTPHYGHLLQSFVKDAVPRYKTMQGYRVKRQWGWDCHGLPIENIVERELGISGREDIEKIGVKKFNDICRSKIFEYADVWEKVIPRIGRWADMKNAYKTMDTDFMESEWWAFKQLYEKGLIYENYRSMHICPRCETTLSQSEVTEGYKDIKDLSVIAKFELSQKGTVFWGDEPSKDYPPIGKKYILAWTTTPWTLPGNVALAVGENIDYVGVQVKSEEPLISVNGVSSVDDYDYYIVAKALVKKVFEGKEYEIVRELKGKDLIGEKYRPLFDYYSSDENLENKENGWKIYAADFVTVEDGTGIVHIAPAFGEDDMSLGKREKLPFVQHVHMNGQFTADVTGDLEGLNVKPKGNHMATDIEIIKYLAHNGTLFHKEKYEHSYPHCWRCDTPLLNYATTSWFVKVEEQKESLLKNAEPINWSPKHIKEGRWGNWLEGARDWSISRNRFWANTMPVWRCIDGCGLDEVMGSIDELEEKSGVRVDDLHKDVVDEVTYVCSKCGGMMRRIPDVLDTWFNSGSVPYATLHYPFENKDEFKKRMPVDFIAEGQDQCRAWFYYQHVLAGSVFDSRAFSNVITTGIVLAEDGKKMSKSLSNYPDPMYIINTYGADATRLYILNSPVVRAENLAFSEKEVGEVSRKIFGRLVNVYEFYALYKDDIEHVDSSKSEDVLDTWIIARLRELHHSITESMENYELDRATRGFADFIDDLSTWYIRRSRDRYKVNSARGRREGALGYKGEDEADKKAALETTRFVLRKLSKLLAPFAPFHADWLWERTRRESDAESVHLTNWCSLRDVDEEVINKMGHVRALISRALDARKEANIKVRQPLASVRLPLEMEGDFTEYEQIVADEVNVKEVVFDESIESVVLDTHITPELAEEGAVRDVLRLVQQARKKAGLKAGDMASARITADIETQELIEKHKQEIAGPAFISDFEFEEGEHARTESGDSVGFEVEFI